jgi:hypothetical protein
MDHATMVDGIGFAAAGLVLATFCMRSMRTLRFVAIASNVAFIAYGYLGHLAPVLWLHALLLPVNICRLMQLRDDEGESRPSLLSALPLRERAARRFNGEDRVKGQAAKAAPPHPTEFAGMSAMLSPGKNRYRLMGG